MLAWPVRAAGRQRVVGGVGQRHGLRVRVVRARWCRRRRSTRSARRPRPGRPWCRWSGTARPSAPWPAGRGSTGSWSSALISEENRKFGLAVLGGEDRPLEQVPDRDTAGRRCRCSGWYRCRTRGRPRPRRADDRVVGGQLAVVGPRLAAPGSGCSAADAGDVGDRVVRVPVGHRVRRRGHEAVAVGEHHVFVDPVLLRVVQPVGVQLARPRPRSPGSCRSPCSGPWPAGRGSRRSSAAAAAG